jgi:hypothetical protein
MNETSEQRRERWLSALDRVRGEIIEIHHHREIWDFLNTQLGQQPDSGVVHEALGRWYVSSQGAAVRRIYEPADSFSLGALLKSLEAHATELTREWFLSLWKQLSEPGGDEHGQFRRMANDTFDKFSGAGGEHMAPDLVAADRERLRAAAHKVARWVSENVAHIGRTQSVTVTYGELDAAIVLIGELLQRYYLLLTAGSLMSVTPAIQEPWQTPFTRAWI